MRVIKSIQTRTQISHSDGTSSNKYVIVLSFYEDLRADPRAKSCSWLKTICVAQKKWVTFWYSYTVKSQSIYYVRRKNIPQEYVFHSCLGDIFRLCTQFPCHNRDSFISGGATDNRISSRIALLGINCLYPRVYKPDIITGRLGRFLFLISSSSGAIASLFVHLTSKGSYDFE